MKTSVKIAIISAIATVLAAVIPVVISIVMNQNDKNGQKDTEKYRYRTARMLLPEKLMPKAM